jgi:hypothetical protein
VLNLYLQESTDMMVNWCCNVCAVRRQIERENTKLLHEFDARITIVCCQVVQAQQLITEVTSTPNSGVENVQQVPFKEMTIAPSFRLVIYLDIW